MKEPVRILAEAMMNLDAYSLFRLNMISVDHHAADYTVKCAGRISIGQHDIRISYEINCGAKNSDQQHTCTSVSEYISAGIKCDIESFENFIKPQLLRQARAIKSHHIQDFDIYTLEYDNNYFTLENLLHAIRHVIEKNNKPTTVKRYGVIK